MPSIDTLVDDIYGLFDPNKTHEVNKDNLNDFAESLKDTIRKRLAERDSSPDAIRFSSLGQPDRKIWHKAKGTAEEELRPQTYFKFLYGDVIEAILLFLAKEAGHTVEREQEEIEVRGVKGHIDAIIDGVVVDVKSASPFGYQKFKNNDIVENDPFGYIAQISGYSNVLTRGQAPAFLAFDKVSGDICLTKVSTSVTKDHEPEERILHLQEVIERDEPPPQCYPTEPDGKSGNEKLSSGCSYCAYKSSCFPNLRTFIYSNGPRYLTKVVRTPDVYEVK